MTLSVPNSAAAFAQDDFENQPAHGKSSSSIAVNFLLLCVLLLASIFAYKDILFNWFSGDDFVHLCWLARTLSEPQLVLHNFYANWLDAFGSAFYRPLVSVSLYFDYLVWHNNGLGFHITNFAFHFISVIFIYFLVLETQSAVSKNPDLLSGKTSAAPIGQAIYLWPLFAAGLFALHPIHPEVVSWIIGRVDSVATAFVMVCLYCYANWRATKSSLSLAGGIAAMILALCSKEIAVLLPVVLTTYELCFGPSAAISDLALRDRLVIKAKELKHLIAFWVLLVAYFIVRQLALGTWLGGYDNTLGLGMPFTAWLAQTWHGFMITMVPVNVDVISNSNALVRIWTYGTATCCLILLALLAMRKSIREILFTVSFMLVALLPVYKIFYVLNSNLEASRYAYLLTVPICMLLGLAIARIPLPLLAAGRGNLLISTALGVAMLASAFGLLRANNMPWHEAGVTSNAIQSGLVSILGPGRKTVAPNVVLVGPPDAYKGSYICRNAIDFMMQHLNIDPKRSAGVVTILDKQKVFPMSHIRALMEKSPQLIEIWHWDVASKKFVRVQPIVENAQSDKTWTPLQALPGLAQIPRGFANLLHWNKDALVIDAKKEPVVIYSDFNSCPTWGLNFLSMNVIPAKDCPPSAVPTVAVPSDRGNIFIGGMPLKSAITPVDGQITYVFPLRSIPAWTLDYAKVPAVPLIFGDGWRGELISLHSIPPAQIMPETSLQSFGGGNFYRLWKNFPDGHLSIDVSSVRGATGWALEVIPTLDQFSFGNPTTPELNSKITYFEGTKAHHLLKLHDLPEGFYCLRVWAVDKDRKMIGVASDHYRVQFKE